MAMYETRSLNMAGIWWMPDKYEDRLMGTLTWRPNDGCLLKLVDDSYEFKWESTPEIIVGLNSDQNPVTLLGCRHAGWAGSRSMGNVSSNSHWLHVDCALVGDYFQTEEEVSLTDLYVEYAGLDEYVIPRYFDFEDERLHDGRSRAKQIIFTNPEYEMAEIDEIEVGLYVGFSLDKDLILQHKLHFSFLEDDAYRSEGANFRLVHVVIPAFLSILMGHQSFLTSLTSRINKASVNIFDEYRERMYWDGNSKFRDRLVQGTEKELALWPALLPAWVENYQAVANLCSAYVKILSDDDDGFFNINNLVHVFFGLEAYHKSKRNPSEGSLKKALKYTICQIQSYFENVDVYMKVADSIDTSAFSHARQVLVHANEGEPDYQLAFQQLIFITRCVLLMEMEYPISRCPGKTLNIGVCGSSLQIAENK